jgi:hypothetical protein
MDKLICPHNKEIKIELENGVVVYKHAATGGYCSHMNVFSIVPDDVIEKRIFNFFRQGLYRSFIQKNITTSLKLATTDDVFRRSIFSIIVDLNSIEDIKIFDTIIRNIEGLSMGTKEDRIEALKQFHFMITIFCFDILNNEKQFYNKFGERFILLLGYQITDIILSDSFYHDADFDELTYAAKLFYNLLDTNGTMIWEAKDAKLNISGIYSAKSAKKAKERLLEKEIAAKTVPKTVTTTYENGRLIGTKAAKHTTIALSKVLKEVGDSISNRQDDMLDALTYSLEAIKNSPSRTTAIKNAIKKANF